MKKHSVLVFSLMFLFLLSGCFAPQPNGTRHSHTNTDAAKTIKSKDITSFTCVFNTGTVYDYPGNFTNCTFTMKKTDDGCVCTAKGYSKKNSFDVEFNASNEALTELQKIIDDKNVVSCNGIHNNTNGVEMYGGSVYVEYSSGENIEASDNTSIPFYDAVEPIGDLFEKYANKAGISLIKPSEE